MPKSNSTCATLAAFKLHEGCAVLLLSCVPFLLVRCLSWCFFPQNKRPSRSTRTTYRNKNIILSQCHDAWQPFDLHVGQVSLHEGTPHHESQSGANFAIHPDKLIQRPTSQPAATQTVTQQSPDGIPTVSAVSRHRLQQGSPASDHSTGFQKTIPPRSILSTGSLALAKVRLGLAPESFATGGGGECFSLQLERTAM